MDKKVTLVIGVLIIVVVALAALLLMGAPRTGQGSSSLTVVAFSGPYYDSLMKTVVPHMKEKYNIDVKVQIQGSAGETLAKIRTEKDSPTFDVWVTTDTHQIPAANEGLIMELTQAEVPNMADIEQQSYVNNNGKFYGVATTKGYVGIAYRTDIYEEPTSWQWLWSDDLYPGKLGILPYYYWSGLPIYAAAYIWGGNEYDIDLGFEKIAELAPNIGLIYLSDAESMRALISGDVPAQYAMGSVTYQAKLMGAPVEFVSPSDTPIFAYYDYLAAVTNGPAGKDLQMLFINEMLDPTLNGQYAAEIYDLAANTKASVPDDLRQYYTFPSEYIPDHFYLAEHASEWYDRWDSEIAPLLG